MYKVILILVLVLVISTGCKVRNVDPAMYTREASVSSERILRQIESRNITNGGFFIQKGRITTAGEAGRINLLFTMKYVKPAKYLISIRSITGMEAFRVYLSSDTVLINDRLNEQLLIGRPVDFERLTGIHPDLLRISLGDIMLTGNETTGENGCDGGRIELESYYKGLLINSTASCGIEKVVSVILNKGLPEGMINIEYKKHRFDYYRIPRRIEVNDSRKDVRITIRIEKYISPWVGDVEFIPGRGYNVKRLI